MGVNQDLYDRTVDHSVSSRQYEESVQIDAKRAIRRHRKKLNTLASDGVDDLSSTGRTRLITKIKSEIRRFTTELNSIIGTKLSDFSLVEIDFGANNLEKSLGFYARVRRPRATKVLEEIVGANIRGEGNLSRRIQALGAGELTRVQSKITNGVNSGLNSNQIKRDIVRSTRLTEAQASALVRTAFTRAQTTAQLSTLKENKAVVKGVRFTAVLDSRTSAICAHHDGKVYDLDDNRYTPPLHWRCRSTLVPVAYSYDELLASTSPDVKQTNLQSASVRQIMAISDAVAVRESYGQWLARQPREVKVRHFQGDTQKVDLFDSGQLPIDRFVTASGKPLSLTALRRIDNRNTIVTPVKQKVLSSNAINNLQINAARPSTLIRNKTVETELRNFYRAEASNLNSILALTDFRGTSIKGKKSSRRRANNQFDERNTGVDPLTGEVKSNLIYEPNFELYQSRLDKVTASKLLNKEQKDWITGFVDSLENDGLSVNQQSSVLENLRLIFERYARDKQPWDNFSAVVRAEMVNSVVNVSRLLDRASRSKSQLFRFGSEGEKDAQVQIMGIWTNFDDIINRTLSNQRFVDNWAVDNGLSSARQLYYGGRAPLRTYFPQPPRFTGALNTVKKNIILQVESLPFGKAFLRKWQGKPTDGAITTFLRSGKERARRFLDLEWALARKKDDWIQRSATPDFAKTDIRLLSEIIADVATGASTDYDLLSINIGKKLYEAKKNDADVLFGAPTLETYHKMGSNILQGLKDQGKIKIGLRGTTRRGVIDLESGRAGQGTFQDTISREVQIVDPAMLRLQRAQQELTYSRRIGFTSNRERLYARAGEKKFYDSRGRKTSVSVVTKKASGNYDQDLIDKDFANMINHASDFEFEVDQDFADFFLGLAHFRDPRGQVAKFDELNGFRKIIIQRGEQGLGLIQSLKYYFENKKSFRNNVQIDGRGRLYTNGYLHPAGGEFVRPFLNSKAKKAISPEVVEELRFQLGTMVGDAQLVLTNRGRLQSFFDKEKEFLELGKIITSQTQKDRRKREFLQHPLVQSIEPEELPKLARLALEYYRIHQHVDGNFDDLAKLSTYRTQLTNENDASSSGAQLIALSTRDRQLSEASNVVPTNRKNRLYDLVAEQTLSDPEFQRINPLGNDINFKDLSKAAKGQSMVAFYGAGQATQAGAIELKLATALGKKGYVVVTRGELRDFNKDIDRSIKQAEASKLLSVASSLREYKKEVNYAIKNSSPPGDKVLAMAKDVHPDSAEFVDKLTNIRGNLIGPEQFSITAKIMSRKLQGIAPITEKFVSFWKDAAETFITDTEKVDIPWVTMDGKVLYQRYRPTVQERITFIDPVTGRRVSNVYEDSITDNRLVGRSSIINARSGFGVNGNHMNDASIVRRFHLWGRKNKIDTATIHDGFFTNIVDSMKAKAELRRAYAKSVESNTLLNTLKEMRRQGLSEQEFKRLVKKARDEGLLDPPNGITANDILAPIQDDEDWYGIGP